MLASGAPEAPAKTGVWVSTKLLAGCVLALGLLAAEPAAARAPKPAAPPPEPSIQIVSADDEAEKANPGVYKRPAASQQPLTAAQKAQFRAALDDVFGPGHWRETSGFRTKAQENALRRQGAGTVAVGRTSRHSIGAPEAPGAYDVVVPGMTQAQAAAKLKAAGQGWGKVAAEAAHGREGAHLHLELASEHAGDRVGDTGR